MLRCPLTHSRLQAEGDFLVAEEGGLAYPVRDGIPVMLIEEARLPAGVASIDELKAALKSAQVITLDHVLLKIGVVPMSCSDRSSPSNSSASRGRNFIVALSVRNRATDRQSDKRITEIRPIS